MSAPGAAVTPARIAFDAGGTPFAEDYGDVYHSASGALGQARHVFLAGNDLPRRWRGRERFAILETGFGLGLNFLCTAHAYLCDPSAHGRLHFVSIENHPPQPTDLERAHAAWPELAGLAAALRRGWPPPLRGFHRLTLGDDRVVLTLLFGDAAQILTELASGCIDACFLDGFAPRKNPHMWSSALFEQIARVCRGDATAATWSVAAQVRSGLQSAGFVPEQRPGFGHKRAMLSARRVLGSRPPAPRERRAIVIGAGVSGCWTAYALTRRGWQVDLIERGPHSAAEASGNPVGALLSAVNLADNENARLARAAFLYASRTLSACARWHGVFARTGLLQVALERERAIATGVTGRRRSQAEQLARMQRILAHHGFPVDYVRWVEADEGTRLAGATVGGPGWWFPAGGWVRPHALCDALLANCGARLQRRFDTTVHRLDSGIGAWRALAADGNTIAHAPTVVVANGLGATSLGLGTVPRLIAVRGQISYLPARSGARLNCVVCGDGYVAPLPEGGLCVGATFEPGGTALDLRSADHEQNLRRAERMLPGSSHDVVAHRLGGRVALRAATADRLPFCGDLDPPPRTANGAGGPHLLAGLGARGLVWAPLCAEVLASRLEDEPNPVEESLIRTMQPARDQPVA